MKTKKFSLKTLFLSYHHQQPYLLKLHDIVVVLLLLSPFLFFFLHIFRLLKGKPCNKLYRARMPHGMVCYSFKLLDYKTLFFSGEKRKIILHEDFSFLFCWKSPPGILFLTTALLAHCYKLESVVHNDLTCFTLPNSIYHNSLHYILVYTKQLHLLHSNSLVYNGT